MKIIKIFINSFLLIIIGFLSFLIVTYNKEFNFSNIYININIKYLYALVSSSLLISFSTYIAQITLSNRLIDASFMGIGPIASFVVVIFMSIFIGNWFDRIGNNNTINFYLPIAVGFILSILGTLLIFVIHYRNLGKKELIILLIVINSLLTVIAITLMKQNTLSQQEYISTFILSSIRQISLLKFIISVSVFVISLILYLIFLHKKNKIIFHNSEYARLVGINVLLTRIFNFMLTSLMLGFASVIAGALSFLGLTAVYISSKIFKFTSFNNIFGSIFIALIINLLTYFIFGSYFSLLNKIPFSSIIAIIGVSLFILTTLKKILRRSYGN